MKKDKDMGFLFRAMFFLDVFLALLVIISARLLFQSIFGRISLLFGLIILIVTTLLNIVQEGRFR